MGNIIMTPEEVSNLTMTEVTDVTRKKAVRDTKSTPIRLKHLLMGLCGALYSLSASPSCPVLVEC